ncbi:MAG: hypothetical protein P8M16_05515 [Acidimicrobiales bacterium]|nr:hypothetical protein [Acidimicrobiales bacterium]
MIESVHSRRGNPARLLGALLFALLGASLLAPDTVDTWADTRDVGWSRTVARSWADPVGGFSRQVSLDAPLRALDGLLHRSDPVRIEGVKSGTDLDAAPTSEVRRLADANEPLRILSVGDSLMLDLQYGLERSLDLRPDVVLDGRGALGFGFTVPHWDWDADVLADYDRLVSEGEPDVVVVMIGANEFEGYAVGGEDLSPGSLRWSEVIAERANEAVARWRADGAHVYWWTTPKMRDERFLTNELNEIWMAVARGSGDGVSIIDSMEVLGDADGDYRSVLRNDAGAEVPLRKEHGVHFHAVGADLLAHQLEEHLVVEGWLKPRP